MSAFLDTLLCGVEPCYVRSRLCEYATVTLGPGERDDRWTRLSERAQGLSCRRRVCYLVDRMRDLFAQRLSRHSSVVRCGAYEVSKEGGRVFRSSSLGEGDRRRVESAVVEALGLLSRIGALVRVNGAFLSGR